MKKILVFVFRYVPIVTLTAMAILILLNYVQMGKPYEPGKIDLIGALTFHFLHGNDLHLLSNLLGFLLAGFIIEYHEKTRETIKLYLMLWLAVSFAVYATGWIFYIVPIIGSSGFVFALNGYLSLHLVCNFHCHIVQRKFSSLMLAMLDLFVFLFLILLFCNEIFMATKEVQTNIARLVHISGFVTGAALYGLRRLDSLAFRDI